MPSDRAEKAAIVKTEMARSLAATSTKVAGVLAVSLLLIWAQQVAPEAESGFAADRLRDKYMSILAERDSVQAPTNLRPAYRQALQDTKRPVKIGSLDLGSVPAVYVPCVWSAICVGLLWYIVFSRRRVLALLRRGVRQLIAEAGYTSAELTDICPSLPWWLLPLPSRDGEVVTSNHLYAAAGWLNDRRRARVFLWVMLATTLVLQTATICASLVNARVAAIRSPEQHFAIFQITALTAIGTLACLLDWLRPAKVPDNEPASDNPNRLRRRDLLTIGVSTGVLVSVLPVVNVIASYIKQGVARKRRHARLKKRHKTPVAAPVSFSGGGLLNPRTGVVHYAATHQRTEPCLKGIRQEAVNRFVPVDFVAEVLQPATDAQAALLGHLRERSPVEGPDTGNAASAPRAARINTFRRVHQGHMSWACEIEALRLVRAKQAERACELLLRAISMTPQSLRLYDLASVIALQNGSAEYQKRVIQAAETAAAVLTVTEPPQRRESWSETFRMRVVAGIGRRAPRKAERKPRRKCGGAVRKRTVDGDGKKPHVARLLKERIAAWQNENSCWYQKWHDGREWRLPEPAKHCKV